MWNKEQSWHAMRSGQQNPISRTVLFLPVVKLYLQLDLGYGCTGAFLQDDPAPWTVKLQFGDSIFVHKGLLTGA